MPELAVARRWTCAVAALVAGCQASALPEYTPAEAEAAGLFAGPRRWTIMATRDATRMLGSLCEWRPPEDVAVAGLGVVVGLRRTGDDGDSAAQLLAFWQQQVATGAFTEPAPPGRPGSAALVAVEAVLAADGPPGAAEVRPIGNAASLDGGRLLGTELRAGTESLATAEGPLILTRVAPDGTVVRDPRRARVATVTPRRPGDARRLALDVQSPLPGAAGAVASALRAAFPDARVSTEPGPPTRVVAMLPQPLDPAAVPALLARPCTFRVAEPGAVVCSGGGGAPEAVQLLGSPPALGLVNLRIPRPTPDRPDAFLRLVGVPAWQGRPIRRALIEFDAPTGVRVRVVCSNLLVELLPVLDRVGLGLREVALYLGQARAAKALAAVMLTEWGPGPDQDRVPDGR